VVHHIVKTSFLFYQIISFFFIFLQLHFSQWHFSQIIVPGLLDKSPSIHLVQTSLQCEGQPHLLQITSIIFISFHLFLRSFSTSIFSLISSCILSFSLYSKTTFTFCCNLIISLSNIRF